MKVFMVLALTLFSVCNANVVWQQQPKAQLDIVKDAFWDYVATVTFSAEDSLEAIKQSELGQEMNSRISQSADAVNQYVVALHRQAAPLTQDLMVKLSQEAEKLKAQVEAQLDAAGAQIQPYTEEMREHLQKQVEGLTGDMTPYAEAMDPEALRDALLQKTEELKASLDQSMTELQTHMVPHAEELKRKMDQSLEQFQSSVVPLAQSFQTQLVQKTREIQRDLAPFGEELKASLDVNAQDLKVQLGALVEAFTKASLSSIKKDL